MKFLFKLLTLLVLCNCTNKENIDVESWLVINPDDIEEVRLSTLFSEVEYLQLLSNDESDLIGDIYHMKVTDDRIYILDAFYSISLNVYNRSGTLEYSISDIGRGPGEFLGPYAFALDEKEEHIIVYDGAGLKLCYYNLTSGEFEKERKIDFAVSRIEVLDDHYVFFLNNMIHTGYNHNIIITDKNLEIIKKELRINPNLANYQFESPVNFTFLNDSLFFTTSTGYDVYKLNSELELSKYKQLDFGTRKLSDKFFENHENNQMRLNELGNSAHNISGYFETDNFFYFNYDVGRGEHQQYYFYFKKESTLIHTNYDNLQNDLNIGVLPRWPRAKTGEELVWPQKPSVLLKYIKEKRNEHSDAEWEIFKKENEELILFSEQIKADGNPYLIFTKVELNQN